MKTLPLIIIAFFLFSCSGKKPKVVENDLTRDHIHGMVKSIIENECYYRRDTGFEAKLMKIVKEIGTTIYNDKGNKVEETWTDSTRKIVLVIQKYHYDSIGNMTEMDDYNHSDSLVYKQKFLYYYHQIIKEQECYTGETDEIGYEYDSAGNIKNKCRQVGCITGVCTFFKYNSKGEMVLEYPGVNSNQIPIHYSYDSNGNMIRKYYVDNKTNSITILRACKYDDKGNMLEDSANRSFRRNEFEIFDNYGNWGKDSETTNGKISLIIERTIKYFPE